MKKSCRYGLWTEDTRYNLKFIFLLSAFEIVLAFSPFGFIVFSDISMRLYEPFAQERQASTANIGGSGLGLSIVKKLVDLMGGEISVKSELGKGTEFTLNMVFERADLTPGQISGVRQASDVLKGTRALLAEDNEMNAEIATLLLETRGVIVTRAENGERACRLFASSEPGFYDLILMDIRMIYGTAAAVGWGCLLSANLWI